VPEHQAVHRGGVRADDAHAAPSAPFEAHRVDGWLVLRERVERSARSAARLDALVAEAARLRGAPAPV
jgi:hypothetical protein